MNSRLSQDEGRQAFEKSLHYLKFRPRSSQEIKRHLRGKGFSDAAVSEALNLLEYYSYVNDEEFARIWIESRSRNRPRGRFALGYELMQKGVAEEIIEGMLAGFDEEKPAWRAVEPKLEQWAGLDPPLLRKKIHQHLKRRGFAYDTCEKTFQKAVSWLGDG
ncbi:MAG: regulatory protein RecX [Desulfosalsimonas sp.]